MSSRPQEPASNLDRIIGERREKADALRSAGSDPYRNDMGPGISIADVRAKYEPGKPPPPPPRDPSAPKEAKGAADEGITPIDGTSVRVAGRVMVKRGMGKTVFAPIRDTTDQIQLYLNVDALDANDFEKVLPQLDAGDIVTAEGPAFWTKRGELSVLVKRLWIVTKSLRPLPDKWHGMTDVELRYRQRYLDLAVSPEVRDVFRKRTQIVGGIRKFLDARNYLEVETPMMHPIVGGAAARPFVTHHNALDMKLYMRIAPELYLKRLVVGGFERVYEINRNFRNEGLSRRHNPEFTMLEFYQAYATYTDLMDITEAMVGEVAMAVNGSHKVTWDGVEIDLSPGWRRISVRNAVKDLGGVAEADDVFADPVTATMVCLSHKLPAADIARILIGGLPEGVTMEHPVITAGLKDAARRREVAASVVERYSSAEQKRVIAGHIGYLLFEAVAEEKLVQPTFLTEFPLAVSPLARKNDKDGAFCDRFELFVNGKEIANGFSELNDPDDQRSRFLAQVRAKDVGTDETMDYDEDYCRALEVGMPPTAGEGIGIDRLTMLLTGQSSIRDVILFPLMRPE
ncbi:MAG TPA: lysine--tRNA ligase [Kofleriaceae bacterium]|jgi:lysyl-tRNA synthetase class 2